MSSTSAVDADTRPDHSEPAAAPALEQTSPLEARSPPRPTTHRDDPHPARKELSASEIVAEAQDDSEAETEILSQDHKDEAANGATIKHENSEDTPMIDAPTAPSDAGAKSRSEIIRSPNGMKGSGTARRASEAGETDREKSRLSSQRTSPTSTAHSVGRRKSSSIDAPTPDAKNGGHDHASPVTAWSRKRKARDEASPGEKREFEPPRQKHKMDRQDSSIQRHSRERSSSPKKYPHRRTISTQAGLPNGQIQKKRKPPALSTARIASYHEESDSESSSDATPHPRTQLKRSSHRSVSTPGRAMVSRKKLKDRYGMTPFAIACQAGELEHAKEALAEDPSMLDEPDNDQNTPLQTAALAGQEHIVEYLIQQRCNIHTMNRLQETPLIDAVENAEVKVVRLLLDAGVDPSRPNKKGRQPIDLVPKADPAEEEEIMAVREIRTLLKDAIQRNHGSNRTPRLEQPEDNEDENKKRKDLDILDRTTKNLRNLVENNDKYGVRTFLEAMVRVDNNCLVAAAKGGHTDLMNVLLPLVDPDKVDFTKPLLAAIGRGHLDIVELLLKQDLDPTLKSADDRFYWEIAEERQGPNWQTERHSLKTAYDDAMARKDKKRMKGSPESRSKLGSASRREKAERLLPPSVSSQERRRHSSSSNVQRPSSPEIVKPKRTLIRGKDRELSSSGIAKRRRVVEDDEDESDEEDVKSSPGRPRVGRPKGSSSPGLQRKERHTSEPTSSKTRDEKPTTKHAIGDIERSRSEKSIDMESSRKRDMDDDGESAVHRERKRVIDKEQAERREKELREKEAREKEVKEREAKEAADRQAEEKEKERLAKEAAEREAAKQESERLAKEVAEREAAEREKERLAKEAADHEAAEQERQRLAREAAEREAEEARRKKAEAEAAAAAETARQEAEEQARREAEQREREQQEREREERLSKLPPAIAAACRFGTGLPVRSSKIMNTGGVIEPGVLSRFTPVIGIQGHEIGISTNEGESAAATNELWILNFQACALLGLHEIDTSRNDSTKQWRVQPSTRSQREGLWAGVKAGNHLSYPPKRDPSTVEERCERQAETSRIKQTWLDCDAIAWVRWADFNAAARQSPRLNVEGVEFSVGIRVHFDYVDAPQPPDLPATNINGDTPQVNGDNITTTNAAVSTSGPVSGEVAHHRPPKRKAAIELVEQGMTGTVAVLRVLQERDRAVPGVGVWRGGEEQQAGPPQERPIEASATNIMNFEVNGGMVPTTRPMTLGSIFGLESMSSVASGVRDTRDEGETLDMK
ncbi:MAG: hypothetical protein Q9165_008076 [Trypethelium subeluteriae]